MSPIEICDMVVICYQDGYGMLRWYIEWVVTHNETTLDVDIHGMSTE